MGNYISYTSEPQMKKYGWKPDLPDHRDQKIYFTENITKSTVDLRQKCPPVYNQGKLGSCTAQAIAFAYEYDQIKQDEKEPFIPSRLFIYYNERDIEGTVNVDSGASIRDGVKTINTIGVCKEDDWKYDISQFSTKPYLELYEQAKNHKSVKYKKINQREKQLKMALKMGFPIIFGISVFESLESLSVYNTGIIPMPARDEKMMGGHAISIVGYNDNTKHFIIRNSWGKEWGDDGYGYIPYDYVLDDNLASDFWIIERVLDKSSTA